MLLSNGSLAELLILSDSLFQPQYVFQNWSTYANMYCLISRWEQPCRSLSFSNCVRKCYSVERPDPKDLSTFNQCTEFLLGIWPHVLQILELGSLTKCLASWMLICVSGFFSTVLPQVPLWTYTWAWSSREVLSAVVPGKWVCKASESAKMMCQAGSVMQPDRLSEIDMIIWSCRGHHCRKTWRQGSFHF